MEQPVNGLLLAAELAATALTGYAAGRTRPADRLLSRAEDTVNRDNSRSPVFWCAATVIVLALIAVWTLHPRRSAENRRSWREEYPREPAPVRDPDWARKRTHPTETDTAHD